MPLIARARQGYCLRLLLVGLGMGAAAAWFAFDAAVAYPRHNVQQAAQQAFTQEQGIEASAKWPQYAKQQGFNPDYNAAAKGHTQMDILTQWIMGAATALLGLLFLVGFALARRRFVCWDGAQLSNHRGVHLRLEEIESVDSTHWADKGMVVVRGRAGGKPVSIALDDWKMEPQATEAIVAALTEITSRPPVL